MPTIVTRLGKGSPLTTAELDANLTNINAETVDNSGVFNLRPSLDIDLVGSKSVSPLVSFSRGSTGTYFDSDGLLKTAGVNQPRFDYDPITKELKGLLVEESRTNLLRTSSLTSIVQVGGGSYVSEWSRDPANITAITSEVIAPDGTISGVRLIQLSTPWYSSTALWQQINLVTGRPATFTVFAKSAGSTSFMVHVRNYSTSTLKTATYDFSSGVASGGFMQSVGNGWWLCGFTWTEPDSYGRALCLYGNTVADSYNGTYFWGAQYEAGSTPTSYIPTTSTTVTRSADQLSINKTSNWFNSTNGTLSLSHDAASGQPLLGDGSSTIISSLGAGTVNIDYSNTQLSVVTQSGQSNNTTGIFNFDTDLYIGGNSTSKINNHIKYLKFYPNNVINSTPDGSGLLLDTGFALLQEDGSVIFQE